MQTDEQIAARLAWWGAMIGGALLVGAGDFATVLFAAVLAAVFEPRE